ncbi:MAG: hypothetical protein KC432_03270, partial [Thermomicrobiales bacterium]|nr:hypothetical protein [Thermomicrobiales bacterium]
HGNMMGQVFVKYPLSDRFATPPYGGVARVWRCPMFRSPTPIAGLLGGLALLGAAAVPALAQEASPPRPSHIHTGDCDELGEVIQPLNSLTVPTGEVLGNSDAVVAEAAFSTIDIPLSELVATDHALKVHLSADQIQTYLVCGDIGGALDADGALIVGLKELDDSGYTGIAYLVPGAGNTTRLSVMIAKVNEGSPAAADAPADAAQAAEPQVVDVALSNFVIDMPETLPAGPTRFAITNNGQAPHNFVIEGNGQSKKLANNLQPGQSGFLNIDLAPGVYTIYCPVGEGAHRAQGMELTLTVQ